MEKGRGRHKDKTKHATRNIWHIIKQTVEEQSIMASWKGLRARAEGCFLRIEISLFILAQLKISTYNHKDKISKNTKGMLQPRSKPSWGTKRRRDEE